MDAFDALMRRLRVVTWLAAANYALVVLILAMLP
jgi:hypothetical protein